MTTITVESGVIVGGRVEPALDSVTLEFLQEEITVADLIRRTVAEQVRVLQARAQLAAEGDEAARAWLARQYGESATDGRSSIDGAQAVRQAQQAFCEGRYLVLVDGRPAAHLEETLTFAPGTSIRFVRLTPLVGG